MSAITSVSSARNFKELDLIIPRMLSNAVELNPSESLERLETRLINFSNRPERLET